MMVVEYRLGENNKINQLFTCSRDEEYFNFLIDEYGFMAL